MKKINVIPVCAITDENLPFSAAVLFVSVMENAAPDAFYKFYCFVTKNTEEKDRNLILKVADLYPDCSVEIIDMGEKYLDSVNRHPTVTNACLYKFSIIEKLTQYDKVLYLDTDIVVNKDLGELYDIDLKNNYVGGVFNIYYYLYRKNLSGMLGIPDLESYFNAGVMLMNLKLMRENNLLQELEKYIGKFQDSVDQHIFNKVCYGKILNIHPKYNFTIKYGELYKTTDAAAFYTNKEIDDAVNDPVIFHYTGIRKPWAYANVQLAWKWYSYYRKSPYKNISLKRADFAIKKRELSFVDKIKNFLFVQMMNLNMNIYTKFGIEIGYYQYFTALNFISRKDKALILIVVENLKSSEQNKIIIDFLKATNKNNHKTFVIANNGGDAKKEFACYADYLFVIKNIDTRMLKTFRIFKFVIISEVNLFKLARNLAEANTSYLWMINNETMKNKILKRNKIASEVYADAKNIVENADVNKILKIMGMKQ